MQGMLHLRSALLLATWLIIGQSKRKIKPHRERSFVRGLKSVQKHVLSSGELKKFTPISSILTLKYASGDDLAVKQSFPNTLIAIA